VTVDIGAMVQEYFGYWNAQQRDQWLDCLDHDVRHEEPVGAEPRYGWEPFAEMFDVVAEQFDEWPRVEFQDLIACGRECAVRFTTTGVRNGETVSSTVIEIWSASETGKLGGVRVFVAPTLGLL
jgi:hypothetical protein